MENLEQSVTIPGLTPAEHNFIKKLDLLGIQYDLIKGCIRYETNDKWQL